MAKDVARGRGLDLGVLAGDAGIAEDADLGALVQAQPAAAMGQQVGAPFLPAVLHLDPGPAQGLLDQGQEQAQPRAEDHDAQGLAHLGAIAQGHAEGLETVAADEAAEAAADQAEDQPLAGPVGQPLAQADAQAKDRPGQARPRSPPGTGR